MLLLLLVSLAMAMVATLEETRVLPPEALYLLAAGAVLPVVLAYRRPVAAWRLAFVMLFLGVVNAKVGPHDEPWPWNAVQILAALFVLGRLAWVSAPAVTAWATGLFLIPVFLFSPHGNVLGGALLVVAVAALCSTASYRRRARELLAEQTELNELERAKRAVLEERTRIAREMHDVVAHHMSMIAVQAETAPFRLAGLPDAAKDELTSIAVAAREALTDMRRLLGVLRAENQEAERAPQPGYPEITELVSGARRAGLAVSGELPRLDGVDGTAGLTAYRIAQEALANAARHAPGGPVRILARADGDLLELDIRNELTSPPEAGHRPGHGLIGMRERVALLGGELTAGPDGAGSYRVLARIPRQPEAP
ncbi:signal transduction histidine kinase [Actinoplanes octamycinicus]|uniref:histidine kinase n=1 Tax=Actinoplanes octamycinicus TaxID=135948 RepID=A0A7W7GX93_9ACTN|nr:signal transduction histidine kinase [Actinoplanes octamycinicus]